MENFKKQIQEIAKKINKQKHLATNEAATKQAFILPFFQALGYNPDNLGEVIPEYIASLDDEKQKVDYGILKNNLPILLVECKVITKKLDKKDITQLKKYFHACFDKHRSDYTKFAILTNGEKYEFYSDLDDNNTMDEKPFWQFNITKITDTDIEKLYQFHKKVFNQDEISENAKNLKYTSLVFEEIKKQFNNPDDEFAKLFLKKIGERAGKNEKEMIKNIIKNTFNQIIKNKIEEQSNTIKQENIQNNNITDNENSGKLIVIFEDGTKFQDSEPKITLAKTIEKIGFEKVFPLEIKHDGIYLISKEKTKFKTTQYGDYYIHTTGNPKTKKEQLQEIYEKLGLNLKIELLENK